MKVTKQITVALKKWNCTVSYNSKEELENIITNHAVFLEDEEQEVFAEKLFAEIPEATKIVCSIAAEATIYER